MGFELSAKVSDLRDQVSAFMDEEVYPVEDDFFDQLEKAKDSFATLPLMDDLKAKAKAAGLWNLFLPESDLGAGLTNLEYAPLAEVMGRSLIGPEAFNCSAPDTGNMETLHRYGSDAQKKRWLAPLLEGKIRSAFCMTEPAVASSDATNIETSIRRDGDDYVINGHKWFASGIMNERCELFIVMGKTDPDAPKHIQQSMILVPRGTPGITIVRPLPVMNDLDWHSGGHGEMIFDNVRVPSDSILLGEGRGFEIAQGRLGPGRIHHCMRLIGMAERALENLCRRAGSRVAFGKTFHEFGTIRADIANSRIEIDQARLLCFHAADMMDKHGNKAARNEIAMVKVVAPNVAQTVIDRAIQVHGAMGMTNDVGLARSWIYARFIRIGDGPDEVHREAIAKMELRRYAN